MSLTRNLGQYEDVRKVLELALANGGGRYVLDSAKATFRWRQRAYMYRKLLREELVAKREQFGTSTITPYDSLLITLSGNCVIITISAPSGVFETLSGEVVSTDTASDSTAIDLTEAEELIRDLGA
jgi:hypothetical protein